MNYLILSLQFVPDPFMVSGSKAVVAKTLNCNYIGFGLNPEFCKSANKRILDISNL